MTDSLIRYLQYLSYVALFSFLLFGFFFRDSLAGYISKLATHSAGAATLNADSLALDSAYNYTRNGLHYQLTWLEFGSTHCRECKLMEEVMQKIKARYPDKVNTVFYNVSLKENKGLAQHYGIVMIPVQIILDKTGKECFRHTGFLSYEDLAGTLTKKLQENND